MYQVEFVNENITAAAENGILLSALCRRLGFPLETVCGGAGTCGKCSVEIDRGSGRETVLACRTRVEGDLRLWLPPEEENGGAPRGQDAEAPAGFFHEPSEGYGAAADIGTTSVVLFLYDLQSGQRIYTGACLNPQTAHGADVMSRIDFSLRAENGLQTLQYEILSCLNGLLEEAEKTVPGLTFRLRRFVLCGNSVMQHIFFGQPLSDLAAAPFRLSDSSARHISGRESGIPAAAEGTVDFLPLLGGFVGADTTSVLLTLPPAENTLVIDLGTNGEIALFHGGRYTVASTACGPALEGGCLSFGMRGTEGAVEGVQIENGNVQIRVVGGGTPRGICGSGFLDAVAEMRRTGVIDESGYLEEDFPLTPDGRIVITPRDIRQIQLAKSAVCAGCLALLARAGLQPEDVSAVYLAGAFGNYIDVDNALAVGLLPAFPRERIYPVGNAAGKGVQLCLLNGNYLRAAEQIQSITDHVELATDPVFRREYVERMAF